MKKPILLVPLACVLCALISFVVFKKVIEPNANITITHTDSEGNTDTKESLTAVEYHDRTIEDYNAFKTQLVGLLGKTYENSTKEEFETLKSDILNNSIDNIAVLLEYQTTLSNYRAYESLNNALVDYYQGYSDALNAYLTAPIIEIRFKSELSQEELDAENAGRDAFNAKSAEIEDTFTEVYEKFLKDFDLKEAE